MTKRFSKITCYVIAIVSVFALLTVNYLRIKLNGYKIQAEKGISVDLVATKLVTKGLVPSISYSVIRNGKINTTRTIGLADVESGDRAESHTLYEAASLTKPVIAEIARRLFKEGVFKLDEKIGDTISNSRIKDKDRLYKLTPQHLLSHTSGLPNWSGDSRKPDRIDQLSFEFNPGTEFQYSGEGYGILLSFLEAKSGRSAYVLATELFEELDMNYATMEARHYQGHYARGHWELSPSRNGWRTNQTNAAYSMFSNAQSYAKFLQYVIEMHSIGVTTGDPFLKTLTPIKTSSLGQRLGWSLGWGTLERANNIIYFQWGDNGAFRSFAAFEPISKDGIVFFTNGSLGTIYADELAAPILGDIELASSWFSDEIKEVARSWLKF